VSIRRHSFGRHPSGGLCQSDVTFFATLLRTGLRAYNSHLLSKLVMKGYVQHKHFSQISLTCPNGAAQGAVRHYAAHCLVLLARQCSLQRAGIDFVFFCLLDHKLHDANLSAGIASLNDDNLSMSLRRTTSWTHCCGFQRVLPLQLPDQHARRSTAASAGVALSVYH